MLGAIAALIFLGGAFAFTMLNINSSDDDSSSPAESVEDDLSDDSNASSDDSDIVSEEIKYNAQNGGGYYREVTYKDGGFRQYDVDTGELIGSSYDSDQDKLPSME